MNKGSKLERQSTQRIYGVPILIALPQRDRKENHHLLKQASETVATSIGVGAAASIRSEESSAAGGSDAKVSCRIPSTVIEPGL
ncbi:hypothetical protein Bca101_026839 [Brassica carinata]